MHTHTHMVPAVEIRTRPRQPLISMGDQLTVVWNKYWGNKVQSSPHQYTHAHTHTCATHKGWGDSISCMARGGDSPETGAVKELYCFPGQRPGYFLGQRDTLASMQQSLHVTWQMEAQLSTDYRGKRVGGEKTGANEQGLWHSEQSYSSY